MIAFNKWDLVDEERRYYLDREVERDLVQVQWAPRINVTARTGWHIDRIVPALEKALEGWETRVSTGQLNSFLGRLVAEHPHPVRSGKQPKVLFGTQAATAPPTFVLFTSGKLDAGYERFIERRLREEFGFVGHPDLAAGPAAGEAQALRPRSSPKPPQCRGQTGIPASTVPPSRSISPLVPALLLGAAAACRVRRDPAGRGRRAGPALVAGCRIFPSNNYWNRDISRLSGAPRSAQWLANMSTSRKLHPDFGPSYGDGPDYGIPITVVPASHPKVNVAFDYAERERPRRLPVRRRHPIEGGRDSGGDMHAVVIDADHLPALRDLEHRASRAAAGPPARAPRGPEVEQPAPGQLDLRRRSRAADPARPAALERGEGGPRGPRDPVHHRRHQPAPPLAGPPRRRLAGSLAYPPMGARFRLQVGVHAPPATARTRGRSSTR